ncbi:phosphate ABC transporter permease subunit PstC [Sphingomonas pituitosa]|uniref:phosphate ABC transporter permease subunit PstC n=1 Tax=Sphingomonas pituitosa TaxID=99597 RepID=UPI00082FD2F4|nr:phosphate ABC transporter permease subunit PstC [Sphingomonas pituitosa]
MNPFALSFVILGLGLIGWLTARARALRFDRGGAKRLHSLPAQHGWFVAMWTVLPPLLFLVVWSAVSPGLVRQTVLQSPTAAGLSDFAFERDSVLAQAREVAKNPYDTEADPLARQLAPVVRAARNRYAWTGTAAAALLAFAGAAFALSRIRPDFRARSKVERTLMMGLLVASLIAIFTTIGIFASLFWESTRFFSQVPITQFLFGTHWSPQVIDAKDPGASLGAVPLFWGTFFIGAVIAMLVAIPFGLMSAVYLTQYASATTRRWMKPTLEMLAGVPTVVYGYFAALTVAPAVRKLAVLLGDPFASSESALAAGLVMGVMIIPFVSSMADDSLAAVPTAMRDGSLAMGATTSETISRVLVPAALPGVVAGVLLAVSRAIGETMIVVMAASGAATITLNPLQSATTVTKQIVDLLTGEAEFDSPKTLAAFALGLTLFVITLLLNIVALRVVKKYREAYE